MKENIGNGNKKMELKERKETFVVGINRKSKHKNKFGQNDFPLGWCQIRTPVCFS